MKQVAKTLMNLMDNKVVKTALDRTSDITTVLPEVEGYWGFDLYSRKPGPAYQNGVFVGTDLDLACFLYELSIRGAVVEIPYMKSIRGRSVKEGQVVTNHKQRHGKIVGLTSNKNTFNFSVKLFDMTVITTDEVGDFRNFTVTDFDGHWFQGFTKMNFMPTAKENSFLNENKLWSGNRVVFTNFAHPNRWTSFYGQYYTVTKIIIERLREEAQFYNTMVRAMLAEGITYPEAAQPDSWPRSEEGPKKKIKVKAFESIIDLPPNETKFVEPEFNQENLVELTRRRKYWVYTLIPRLQFMTRITELAFWNHVQKKGYTFPAWIKDASWEENYVPKGKRTKYNRLVLFQPKERDDKGHFLPGISLMVREWEKTENVSNEYDESLINARYKQRLHESEKAK